PRRRAVADRLVLVQSGDLWGRLEPKGVEPPGRHGLEHFADSVGISRHGIGGAEFRCGREPETRRPAGLHVWYAWRGRYLHSLDDGDSRHRAKPRIGKVDRTFRNGLCAYVQPGSRVDHHGARGGCLPRFIARVAVHDGSEREGRCGWTDVSELVLESEPDWRADHLDGRIGCRCI